MYMTIPSWTLIPLLLLLLNPPHPHILWMKVKKILNTC